MSCETYTSYAADDDILLHKHGKLTMEKINCHILFVYIYSGLGFYAGFPEHIKGPWTKKYTNILHIYVINVDVRIQCWHHPEQASYQLSANHSVTPGKYIYKHTMYTNGIYIYNDMEYT